MEELELPIREIVHIADVVEHKPRRAGGLAGHGAARREQESVCVCVCVCVNQSINQDSLKMTLQQHRSRRL